MKAGVNNTWTWLAMLLVMSMSASSYSEEESIPRDPFWPVGYEKPKPPELVEPEVEEPADKIKAPRADQVWPALPVQGISRGVDGQYFALVRGMGVVSAGEDVSLEKDGLWYHWHVADIGPGGLRARKLGVSEDRNTIPRPATPAGKGQPVKE